MDELNKKTYPEHTGRKFREIWADYDDEGIVVYQAYKHAIAKKAVVHQQFVEPFQMGRMTWIKPSFLWMMYRCGWANKKSQEVVLRIKITHEGFLWALRNAALAHHDGNVYESKEAWKKRMYETPVRIQWDPERGLLFQKLDWRSIQIGLGGESVQKYVHDWVLSIEDITERVREVETEVRGGHYDRALSMLPVERRYHLPEDIPALIGTRD